MPVTPGPVTPAPGSAAQAQAPLRVVIAEDTVLLREGLRRVLTDAGLDVAGAAGDAEKVLAAGSRNGRRWHRRAGIPRGRRR
jgi:hypothetical protein